jgi:hypothetical protein
MMKARCLSLNVPAQLMNSLADNDVEEEAWEEELDVHVLPAKSETQDWAALRQQINKDLKLSKALPQRQINQLLIIRNFATLCLKASTHIQASLEIAWQ